MTRNRRLTPSKVLLAVALAICGVVTGWLSFSAAVARALPPRNALVSTVAARNPDVVLDKAMLAFTERRGVLPPAMLRAVGEAARRAPLDARPYLFFGQRALLAGQGRRATALFEAGRRLDPRQRWLHVLLLDRYLRTGRYGEAAAEFSVLARLIGAAQPTIAVALAQMSVAPETRDAARRTLRMEPRLELAVLASLARSNTDPAVLFDLASPAAMLAAGRGDSWGPALVDRLVATGRYREAFATWRRTNRLPDVRTGAGLYDADFRGLPGTPPFNWALTASGLGVAEIRAGRLTIQYYGRDTGELAAQLLVMPPGRYRLGFDLGGAATSPGTTLSWTLACVNGSGPPLLNYTVPPVAARPRRATASFSVPPGCPAQRLALMGNAGEFPAPIEAAIQNMTLQPTASHP